MLRSKKGMFLVEIIWLSAALTGIVVSQLPIVKTSFREKKAIEQCKATEYFTVDCESSIAGMSKAEVLDYIRDDDMSTGNKGNF